MALLWSPTMLPAQTPSQPAAGPTVREMSRTECIALALENNLDIRIARHEPRLRYYALRGAYGYYEPTFNLQARQQFNKTEPSLDEFGVSIPGARGFNNSASGAFTSARTPFGSEITLGSSWAHQYGTRSVQLAPGLQPIQSLNDQYTGSVGVQFRQDLLRDFWIDGNRLAIQLNKGELQISELALQQRVMQVVTTVEQAYFELTAALENVKVAEISLELNERLLAETKQRVQVGVAVPLDEKQVEAEVAAARADLIAARAQLLNADVALKRELTDDYGSWYNVRVVPSEKLLAVPETFSLNESWMMGVAMRPDYNQAKLEVELKGIEVKYAKNQLFPTLQFVFDYSRSGVDQDGSFSDVLNDIKLERNASYAFGGVFSIPLGNTTARNRYKARKEEMEQIKNQLTAVHLDVLADIEIAVNLARASFERVTAQRERRLHAAAAFEAEQKKMDNGKSTTYLVLEAQQRLTAARYAEISALRSYNEALARLYFEEGSTLERHRIQVEYR